MTPKKKKSTRKEIMACSLFILAPFVLLFGWVVYVVCREWAIAIKNWIEGLFDFTFLGGKLDPPANNLDYGCALYGMHGSLTEFGNGIIRELSKNNISFYVGKNGNEFICYLCSADGINLPYRHLVMKVVRDDNQYPISIYTTTGKQYSGIKTEQALRNAVKEILQSNEVRCLLEAMLFVFWGRYENPSNQPTRAGLISAHGIDFVKKYESLIKLRDQKLLILDKEREELVLMYQEITPTFAFESGDHESTDLERLTALPLLGRI